MKPCRGATDLSFRPSIDPPRKIEDRPATTVQLLIKKRSIFLAITGLHVGHFSIWDRFGLPGLAQLLQYRDDVRAVDTFYNVWSNTLQSMVFDEGAFVAKSPALRFACVSLLLEHTVLCVLAIYALLYAAWSRLPTVAISALFFGLAITLGGSYTLLNLEYPFACTPSFRYIAIVVAPLFCSIGLVPWNRSPALSRIGQVTFSLLFLASAASALLFAFLAV